MYADKEPLHSTLFILVPGCYLCQPSIKTSTFHSVYISTTLRSPAFAAL